MLHINGQILTCYVLQVCCHRMRNFVKSSSTQEIQNEWANGKCFILNNELNADENDPPVEPCAKRGGYSGGRNIEKYGYCQSGMSASMSKVNNST